MARRKRVRVMQGGLSNRIWAVTRYKQHGEGLVSQEKYDVTDDVMALLSQAWSLGWDACAETPKGESALNPYVPKRLGGGRE